MGFAEAWRNIKKPQNVNPDEQQKVQKDLFTVFAAPRETYISEKQAPVDPAPRTHEAEAGDWYDNRICEAIDDLADVQMMDYPEHVREKARALFDEFSEAAAADDMPRFWKALVEWRQTWVKSMH